MRRDTQPAYFPRASRSRPCRPPDNSTADMLVTRRRGVSSLTYALGGLGLETLSGRQKQARECLSMSGCDMIERRFPRDFTRKTNSASPEINNESQAAALLAKTAHLEKEICLLQRELAFARTELTSSEAALAKCNSDLGELSQALKASRQTIETIFRSRSWRWLSPIRRFNLALRCHRQKIRLRRFF